MKNLWNESLLSEWLKVTSFVVNERVRGEQNLIRSVLLSFFFFKYSYAINYRDAQSEGTSAIYERNICT